MKPQEQIVWVQEKFKIDINDIKVAYKKVYDERRDLNRDAKKLETEIASANIKQEDLDLELVDVSELTQELKTANEHNQKLALKQKDFENLSRKIETNDEAIENCENEIERAKKKIAELKKDSENIDSEKSKITIFLQKNPVIDTSFIEEQIEQAGNQNMVVQRVGAVKSKKEELEKIKKLVTKKSTELDEIKIEECKRIASSNLPEGFELQIATDDSHEEGLYYKGLPFSELNQSTSEIMKATILIQQAINPNGLKIACIQRYESVGSAKRKEIEKFMKENDLQAIVEVMDTSKHELVISEKI